MNQDFWRWYFEDPTGNYDENGKPKAAAQMTPAEILQSQGRGGPEDVQWDFNEGGSILGTDPLTGERKPLFHDYSRGNPTGDLSFTAQPGAEATGTYFRGGTGLDTLTKAMAAGFAAYGFGAGAMGAAGAGGGAAAGAEAGAGAGAAEGASVYGGLDAGAISAGSEAGLYSGAGNAGATSAAGDGMWDFADGALFDEWSPAVTDAYSGGGEQFFDPAWADEWSPAAVGDSYGGATQSGGGIMDWLRGAGLTKSLLSGLGGMGGGGAGAAGGLGGMSLGQAGFNSLPFLLALTEANRQENSVAPIMARTNALTEAVSPTAVRDAALGPYNRETASGLDRLNSSLSSRGVMGSSFGDASIADYKTGRDVGAGELGTKASLGAIGTSGALLDQLFRGTNAMNANRNLLLGAGLNASGRLFEPKSDPFGLAALLGGR